MTDNEIIKVLKRCGRKHNEENDTYCEECQFKSYLSCVAFLCDRTIDLINRQKEEIERLKDENKSIRYCYEQAKSYNDTLAESCEKNCKHFNMTTRAEAIKEFAEKLKNCFAISGDYLDIINIIDNLVKEMTEVETNQRKEDEGK